jgi:hypothetical protein
MNSGQAFLGASVLQATDDVLQERILADLKDRTISVTVLENQWKLNENNGKSMNNIIKHQCKPLKINENH